MPGCLRHSLSHMLKEVEEAWKFGVRTFVVFPKVRSVHLKRLSECIVRYALQAPRFVRFTLRRSFLRVIL